MLTRSQLVLATPNCTLHIYPLKLISSCLLIREEKSSTGGRGISYESTDHGLKQKQKKKKLLISTEGKLRPLSLKGTGFLVGESPDHTSWELKQSHIVIEGLDQKHINHLR